MSEDEPRRPSTGAAGRLALVVAVLIVAMAAVAVLWPERGRGEREQAHRVLIVGGTPTDLVGAIAEAGFDATQRTWSDAEAEVVALEGRFDLDALLGYADEHGYGFVALMLDDDFPWTRTVLGVAVPEHASAAVISVGELRPSEDTDPAPGLTPDPAATLRFGGPPLELDYAPGLRRIEGLRLALYEHPDLLRLWDEPTPEQMQQQVPLRGLADARVLLERAAASYEAAVEAWPAVPEPSDGALTRPWHETRGFPVAGGLVVEQREQRRFVNARRELELRPGEPRVVFVPDEALAGPAPLARARPLDFPLPRAIRLSADRRWLLGERNSELTIHRYEAAEGGLIERERLDAEPGPYAISNAGETAHAIPTGVATSRGPLELDQAYASSFAWYDDERLALAVTVLGLADQPELLVLARPDPDGAPSLLSLRPAELIDTRELGGGRTRVLSLHPSTDGLFVVVDHLIDEGGRVQSLVRLRVPEGPGAPRPVTTASARLGGEQLRTSLRPAGGFDSTQLGTLSPTNQLTVAPDGRWVAWRIVGRSQAVRAAPIEGDRLGRVIELDPGSPEGFFEQDPGPWFRPDGRALVFSSFATIGPAERLRRSDEAPWLFTYVRVVPVQ